MNKKMKNISLMCISLFSSLVFAGNPIEIKSNQDLNSINFSNIKTIIQEIKSFDKKDEFTKQSVIDEKYKSYILLKSFILNKKSAIIGDLLNMI